MSRVATSMNLVARKPFSRALSCLLPQRRVDGQGAHLSGLRVEKGAVMGQLAVSKELRQHGQRARSKGLVDERLLPVQSLKSGTAGQRVFTGVVIDDFRVQFADRAQAVCLPAVARVQWLAKDILPAGCIVAKIEPIARPAQRTGE